MRSAGVYKSKLDWFKYVGYQAAAQWTTIRNRYPTHAVAIQIARQAVVAAERKLIDSMDTYWEALPRRARADTGRLYVAKNRYQIQLNAQHEWGRKYMEIPHNSARQRDEIRALWEDAKVETARLQAAVRDANQALITGARRTRVGNSPSTERVLLTDGAGLVPFAPGFSPAMVADGDGRLIGNPERNDKKLLSAIPVAIASLNSIARRIESWNGSHQKIIYDLIVDFSHLKAAILEISAKTAQQIRDGIHMEEFTEDMKKELVYKRETRPRAVRDFSAPRSLYADI
jgi:hypothetical protein